MFIMYVIIYIRKEKHMKEIISIRLNEQDKEDIEYIKKYLKNKYKDLPAFIREVNDTDALKYAICLTAKRMKMDKKYEESIKNES